MVNRWPAGHGPVVPIQIRRNETDKIGSSTAVRGSCFAYPFHSIDPCHRDNWAISHGSHIYRPARKSCRHPRTVQRWSAHSRCRAVCSNIEPIHSHFHTKEKLKHTEEDRIKSFYNSLWRCSIEQLYAPCILPIGFCPFSRVFRSDTAPSYATYNILNLVANKLRCGSPAAFCTSPCVSLVYEKKITILHMPQHTQNVQWPFNAPLTWLPYFSVR